MTHFETVCRDKGIKRTHQRIEIFREVAQAEDHPDAEQIFQRVQKRMPTVSLDTVYRTLWLLHELGLVITLHSGRERTHFDANLEKHHHFVCEHCGFTRDFHCSDLDRIRLPDVLKNFGKVKTAQVEARGLCKACLLKK
ncbi:Fur family transcriptional regulator [Desulfogranum japonicum]|uniref:Fur family transcriptional regulator n=1 Tax=Desulfogranum japonicum TaxID=231447 RepID=UPI0003F8217B|nr:transcriptional repressor [Desulfogranum japonicum]